MKIDIDKLGYRWKGHYAAGAVYQKGDVVRKDGRAQMFDGLYWKTWAADQQNATYAGELATVGSTTLLRGALDQQLYVNAAGDDLEFRYGEGRTSSACVDIADVDNGCGNGNSNGGDTAAALMSDGTVCMWGYGGHGNMGDGTGNNRSRPVRAAFPPGTPPIVKITRGYYSTFAIDADGKLWAWGYNNYGQLGTNTGTSNVNVPTLVSGKGDLPYDAKVVQVKSGSGYYAHTATLIRTEDGRVYHTGYQAYYSAGTQDGNPNHSVPKLVRRSIDTPIADMFVFGIYHAATWLIDTQGRLWGAGEQNSIGRLHNNANEDVMHQLWNPSTYDPVVKLIYEESDEHVNAGNQYYRQYMIITQGGRIWSWGHGSTYSSGTNYISDPNGGYETWVPKLDSRIDNVVDGYVGAGWYHQAMVLKADGTVWAIGNNQDGLFEPNAQSYAWVPVYPNVLNNVVKLFPGGGRHGKSCGYLTADGKWYMSGMNNYGQSGNGSTSTGWTGESWMGCAKLPAPITKLTVIGSTNDSANYQTIYALCGDGNLYSWGYNASSQLGWDDDQEYSCVPSPVLF